MVSEDDVRQQLKEVIDPDLEINIVDLGLIYEVKADDGEVFILMTLTTPGCPLHGVFDELVKKEVRKLDVDSVEVELTFEPRWTPEKISEDAQADLGNIPGMNSF